MWVIILSHVIFYCHLEKHTSLVKKKKLKCYCVLIKEMLKLSEISWPRLAGILTQCNPL